MGHIVAGHHDTNSGASILVSVVMNLIIPGSGLIKSALSFAGSQMAAETNRDKQIKEADEVAMKLLEAAGFTGKSVALNLRLYPLAEDADKGSWAKAFRISARNLTGPAPGRCRPERTPVAAAGPAASAPRRGAAANPAPPDRLPALASTPPVRFEPVVARAPAVGHRAAGPLGTRRTAAVPPLRPARLPDVGRLPDAGAHRRVEPLRGWIVFSSPLPHEIDWLCQRFHAHQPRQK